MIVTCPACETRYLVDDSALGGDAGRQVRCASCGNIWLYSPEAAAIQAAVAEVAAEAEAHAVASAAATPTAVPSQVPLETGRSEPRADTQPRPTGPSAMPRPSVEVVVPGAVRRRGARTAGLGLLVLAAAFVVVAILARDKILAVWPTAAPIYSTLRLTDVPGAGLEVTVAPSRTPDSLVIDGDIVNGAKASQQIPKLRVTLHDGNKNNLESKVIDPPVAQLLPGARAHFNTVFEHPSITATGVDVTFATN